jgi:hypothetical protein
MCGQVFISDSIEDRLVLLQLWRFRRERELGMGLNLLEIFKNLIEKAVLKSSRL